MKTLRLDSTVSVDDLHKDERSNGIVIYEDAVLLRSGPMPYRRAGDGDNKWRWEHLPPEEVTADVTVDTMRAAPVTEGHPPSMITEDNISGETRGVSTRDVRVTEVDDEHYGEVTALVGDLVIFDPELVAKIEDGKAEISTGREVMIVEESGEFKGQTYDVKQTRMETNHIGVVDAGRCGETCSIDSVEYEAGISFEREDVIREVEDQWCIFSKDGERLECKDTREEAEKRLQEIEFFSEQDDLSDSKITLNVNLDEFNLDQSEFAEFINEQIDQTDQERDAIIREIAGGSNRTAQEVLAQVSGMIRPSKAVVNSVSQVLQIDEEKLLSLLPFNDLDVDNENTTADNRTQEGNKVVTDNENTTADNRTQEGNKVVTDGEEFGNWLDQALTRRAVRGSDSLSELVGRIAENSGRSDSTIQQIRGGGIECPPAEVLESIALVLEMETDTVVDRARRDGCSYSQQEFSEDIDLTHSEDENMTIKFKVDGDFIELPIDCVECEDDSFDEAVDELKSAIDELERENTKLEGALDQKDEDLKEAQDQLEEMEQTQPGESPEGEESGGGEDEAMKLRLVMAIRNEEPDYSFTDEQGNVKSTEEIMKDALSILGDVNLEEATDSLKQKLEDEDYLRARVDVLLENREGTKPGRNPEEPEAPDEITDVQSLDVEELKAMDLEDLEDIDSSKLDDEAATAYYTILSDKRREEKLSA